MYEVYHECWQMPILVLYHFSAKPNRLEKMSDADLYKDPKYYVKVRIFIAHLYFTWPYQTAFYEVVLVLYIM